MMTKEIRDFFNGVAFGITETVPGVSGGTIAVIFGFYDELIESINNFAKDRKKCLRFLLPVFLGTAAGILVFSSITHYLLTDHSFPTMAFFIGLIVGIVPLIYAKVKDPGRGFSPGEAALIACPILLLVVVSHLKGAAAANPEVTVANVDASFMAFIFFSGILAAAALVIPGISGSFVLLLLGVYPMAIYCISQIRFLLTDITNLPLMLSIAKVLIPLGIGVIIGGLATVRVIEKLLKNYYKIMYSIILGLLVGSVYSLFKDPIVYQSGINVPTIAAGALTFTGGCLASFNIGKKRL
jgi:putative membrane protein